MWRALADPEGVHLWPSRPDPADYSSPSWWLPAVELMAYSLAWPRLDLGLRWWYDAGQPTDDPRLLLLRQMLGGDVDELAAWAWSSNYADELCQRIAAATQTEPFEARRPPVDDAWKRAVADRIEGLWSPFGGESDPMHLSVHAATPIEDSTAEVTFVHSRPNERRAVMITNEYAGWYTALAVRGGQLPALPGNASWRVDVVCGPVGLLGTYRRSRVTGRWFAGRHRYHTVGADS